MNLRMPRPLLGALALCLLGSGLGLASSCGIFYTEIESRPCPTGGTPLTYQGFGAAFFATWCQSCHGSQSLERHGAPGEFIFDTPEQIRHHRARIFARSAAGNDSMPPGPDDPSSEDREKLAEWLSCGAP
jgi:hypothetical protein